MTDVFISYKRSDLDQVTRIAEALRGNGLSVWYDANLQSGSAYDKEITQALRAAKAVLVCWSKESVESDWVRAEATEGRQRGVLVSCLLEPCQPFPPFNLIHHEDLSDWRGAPEHIGWRRTLAALGARVGRPDLQAAAGETPPLAAPKAKAPRPWLLISVGAGIALVTLGALAAVLLRPGPREETPPAETAAIEDAVPPASGHGSLQPQPNAAPPASAPATATATVPEPPAREPASAPGAPATPNGFRMLPEGQPTFGAADRTTVDVAFSPDKPAAFIDGGVVFDSLVKQAGKVWTEGADITAPQIRDEALAVLRDRRIRAIVDALTSRGMPANAIAIQYEPRDLAAGQTDETFTLTLYTRPVE